MKIENGTPYETRALRRIICAVHNDLARREGRRLYQWARLRVVVKHTRGNYVNGCAWLGGSPVTLRLPKATKYQEPASTTLRVVQLVAHELMHSYGYTHDQYTDPLKVPEEWRVLAEALGIGERVPLMAPRSKPKRDVRYYEAQPRTGQ